MTAGASATPEEIAAWLRLTRAEGIDEAAVRLLLTHIGLPETIFAQGVETLARLVGRDLATRLKALPGRVQEEIAGRTQAWLEHQHRIVLTIAETSYPPQLIESGFAPLMLFIDGRASGLAQSRLALVAPEEASVEAIDCARRFARALAERGIAMAVEFGSLFSKAVIEALLPVKGADLVAVLTDGPDRISPADQVALARTVSTSQTLLSSLAPGETLGRDLRRQPNRTLIGLCSALLVIEAPLRSRVLASARLAGEAGRDVMAVPGSIHSPVARGCHRLIREGARLVDRVDDIVEEIQRIPPKRAPTSTDR